MHVDVAVRTLVCLAPDRPEQATLGDHPTLVGEQHAQQLELAGGEVHETLAHADLVTCGVEHERTCCHATARRRLPAPVVRRIATRSRAASSSTPNGLVT